MFCCFQVIFSVASRFTFFKVETLYSDAFLLRCACRRAVGQQHHKSSENEKNPPHFCEGLFSMVRPKRFELLAYRFVACCSIQLSYERVRSLLKESPLTVKRLKLFFFRSSKKVFRNQELRTGGRPPECA